MLRNFLAPHNSSRLDNLEERVQRLENLFSRYLSLQAPRRTERRTRAREIPREKGVSIYSDKGWTLPRREPEPREEVEEKPRREEPEPEEFRERSDVRLIPSTWRMEFECPVCHEISDQGLKHESFKRLNGTSSYNLLLTCNNCGWEDRVEILAGR